MNRRRRAKQKASLGVFVADWMTSCQETVASRQSVAAYQVHQIPCLRDFAHGNTLSISLLQKAHAFVATHWQGHC
jgi:hypothetical protein